MSTDPSTAPAALDERQALGRLIAGEDLSRGEVEELFGRLMDGELSEPIKAGLLVALRAKGETAAEIAGAAAAMRRRVVPIPHAVPGVIDTCGTGGDGRGTFNISTAAALVAAAAGAPVAKHGNRSVSSRSGSADVLERLGVPIESEPAAAGRALAEIGIAFLFAPRLHPAMREAMPVRRALGVRTLFNVLGPLTNPAGARRQLLGVFDDGLVETLAHVLAELGSERAMVVHGSDGLDEITTTGPTRVAELRDGAVTVYELEPRELGVERAAPEALAGGGPEHNAELMRRVLAGEPGPLSDITALNAAAALYVAGLASDLAAGLALARATISSGAVRAKLEQMTTWEAG
jgi:anthranilate phosphoribosyltransferase